MKSNIKCHCGIRFRVEFAYQQHRQYTCTRVYRPREQRKIFTITTHNEENRRITKCILCDLEITYESWVSHCSSIQHQTMLLLYDIPYVRISYDVLDTCSHLMSPDDSAICSKCGVSFGLPEEFISHNRRRYCKKCNRCHFANCYAKPATIETALRLRASRRPKSERIKTIAAGPIESQSPPPTPSSSSSFTPPPPSPSIVECQPIQDQDQGQDMDLDSELNSGLIQFCMCTTIGSCFDSTGCAIHQFGTANDYFIGFDEPTGQQDILFADSLLM